MSAVGIVVLPFPPKRIRTAASAVTAEIRGALATGRPLPQVRALPAR
jgi:hypothetical protein